MSDRVLVEISNHVAVVTLNRPDKHNALDFELFKAIIDTGESLAENREIRAVVLRGEGPSFCSGIDFPSFSAGGQALADWIFEERHQGANNAQMTSLVWQKVPVPVICAIHGNAFGGGTQIAAGADIRIATPDARLSIMEVKWGLVPDMGITVALDRILRRDVIKELTYTGRILTGEQAAELGLVTRTADDPLAASMALAEEIAGKSPDAVRGAKRLYDAAWTPGRADALKLEMNLQKQMFSGANHREAVAAAMQKQTAEFSDPSI
jgi:enoyl-CoA hydratase/carnithine racemase